MYLITGMNQFSKQTKKIIDLSYVNKLLSLIFQAINMSSEVHGKRGEARYHASQKGWKRGEK